MRLKSLPAQSVDFIVRGFVLLVLGFFAIALSVALGLLLWNHQYTIFDLIIYFFVKFRFVFNFLALCSFLLLIYYRYRYPNFENISNRSQKENIKNNFIVLILFLFVLLGAVVQGWVSREYSTRDGEINQNFIPTVNNK